MKSALIEEFEQPPTYRSNTHCHGSLIPSRMRRCIELIVQCGNVPKVREHTIVHMRSKEDDEKSVVSYNHITAIDGDLVEKNAEDTPPQLEEGVQATVDELKEINLGTEEEPSPIFISTYLSLDEEKTCVQLLQEY